MQLDDLITQVQDASLTEDPLDRLSAAMGVKADFDDLTDTLIGHFVDQARRAGRSWSEIGSAMGVTKQAAQQRHTTERPRKHEGPRGSFTRFSEHGKAAVREATTAAEQLEHGAIGTEHLLLGVLAVPDSTGARVLSSLGLTSERVTESAKASWEASERGSRRRRHTPFTQRAKKSLELAFRESLTLGVNRIGTEHLLLGILRERSSSAAKLLAGVGITREALLAEITKAKAA